MESKKQQRLKKQYYQNIVPKMLEKFKYKNIHYNWNIQKFAERT